MPEAAPIPHRHLWSLDAMTAPECLRLIAAAHDLKHAAPGHQPLRGRHVAVLGDAPAAPAYAAFGRAVAGLGARLSLVRPGATAETARLLGRFYDALDCEGLAPQAVERLDVDAGVPVYRGLADPLHPTRMLALLLGLVERCGKALPELRLAYLDDPRTDAAAALVRATLLGGAELRLAAPQDAWADEAFLRDLDAAAARAPGRLRVMRSAEAAAAGADAVLREPDLAPAALPAADRCATWQAMLVQSLA